MWEPIITRLSALLTVKSLVTIILTIVFAVQTCRGILDQHFMTIFTVVISFYFGVQSTKEANSGNL